MKYLLDRFIEMLTDLAAQVFQSTPCKVGDGGIRLTEDFVLNSSLFNQSEKEELLVVLQGLEVTGLQHENELLTKLTALFKLNQPSWIEVDFTSWFNSKKYEELF